MKKIALTFVLLNCFLFANAQAWDLVDWGLYSGINAKYGNLVEEFISPYTNCLIGNVVTLQSPDYLFHKYNWKHEEGKKEIDRDKWDYYVGKEYTVTRVGFGAEAGFFQYGVVFELERYGEIIYAVIRNKRILENDGMATIFKESVPCPDWYKLFIEQQTDPFSSEVFRYSKLARLTDDQKAFVAIGVSANGEEKKYKLILHVGSNKERIATNNMCEFVFEDKSKITFPVSVVETTYLEEPYKFYYSVSFDLTEEQINQFSSSYITAVRLDNIPVTDIRQSVGQRIMYIAQELLD